MAIFKDQYTDFESANLGMPKFDFQWWQAAN